MRKPLVFSGELRYALGQKESGPEGGIGTVVREVFHVVRRGWLLLGKVGAPFALFGIFL